MKIGKQKGKKIVLKGKTSASIKMMNTVRAKAWTENQRLKAGREDVRDMPG